MRRSRLSKKTQKKSMQTIALSILGILAILFLLIKYGIPLISDTSFLFGRITGRIIGENQTQEEKADREKYVPSPDLDPLPKATKEQNIKIGGTSLSGFKIVLYLNGSIENEKEANSDGTFEFDVTLSEGENIIKAKAVKDLSESEFSDSSVIAYKKEGPKISIDSPKDGETIFATNPINITGKTDKNTIVTVNDFQAIITGDTFSYGLTLKDGDNEIKITATDLAGNKTEKIIRVNYSP